jgi:hypothetical protein
MLDSKFMITLVGLIVAVLAICNINPTKAKKRENFGMNPSMTWKIDVGAASSHEAARKGDFYSVPGTYQAILDPRFSNVDYGANIRYNMPTQKNQGVPCNPLTFGNMAQENYSPKKSHRENYGCSSCGGGCGPVSCRKGGIPKSLKTPSEATPVDYAGGNYNEVLEDVMSSSSYPETTSMLPLGDMTTVNSLGETIQPVTYERFIYANRNSRLRSQGDWIRGDLPIVPCKNEWFRPSVQPNIDLNQGAMNVLGGINNGTGNELAALINATSGGADTTISGVNMATQFSQSLGAGQRDVQVTAFP